VEDESGEGKTASSSAHLAREDARSHKMAPKKKIAVAASISEVFISRELSGCRGGWRERERERVIQGREMMVVRWQKKGGEVEMIFYSNFEFQLCAAVCQVDSEKQKKRFRIYLPY